MSRKPEDKKEQVRQTEIGSGDCGATHADCPNTWKGSCDRASGHDGSHHCSSCNGLF
jgi:hypothetical protein